MHSVLSLLSALHISQDTPLFLKVKLDSIPISEDFGATNWYKMVKSLMIS